jgi:hypothetical protein
MVLLVAPIFNFGVDFKFFSNIMGFLRPWLKNVVMFTPKRKGAIGSITF